MKKNILIITTPFRPNIGGVETHLDDLIEEGVKRGLSFTIVTYQPLVTKAHGKTIEKGKGFKIYRIPWLRMNLFLILEKYPPLELIYLFPALFLTGLFFLLFKKPKVDVIHTQGLVAGTVGVILGKFFKKKTIISTHSIYNFPKSGVYFTFAKLLFNNCAKILCLSYQSKQEILSLGVTESKVNVFTYWVDQKLFHPVSKKTSREAIGENNDGFFCLFVGRLVEGKGIPQLLKAASLLKDKIRLIVVGDGPLADLIISAEKKLTNVIFEGKVDNSKLPKYYNSANVLIVPSTHEEGYGRVILEALSCGLPIIATNRGGIKEYVNQKIGILINVTPMNIKNSVISLLENPKRLNIMSFEAHNYAKIHFNKNNCAMIFKEYE